MCREETEVVCFLEVRPEERHVKGRDTGETTV